MTSVSEPTTTVNEAFDALWPAGGKSITDCHPLDQASLVALEWLALASVLSGHCITTIAKTYWQQPKAFELPEAIEQLQAMANQCSQWVEQREIPEFPHTAGLSLPLTPLVPNLKLVQLGQTLPPEGLGKLAHQCAVMIQWARHVRQLYNRAGKPACFQPVFDQLTLPNDLADTLTAWFSPDGRVTDEASLTLANLRQNQRQQEETLQRTVQGLLAKHAQHLQDTQPTERDGRVVLAFQASYKHVAGGVVHDVSASGQTAYVEPATLLPLNNQRRQCASEIAAEIDNVCQAASALVSEKLEELNRLDATVAFLDVQIASARLSLDLHAQPVTPIAVNGANPPAIHLTDCRHPLSVLAEGREGIVANTLTMGSVNNQQHPKTLVITGPNTGGKSVLLKTIGLCAWMLRFGLLLPVSTTAASAMSILSPIGAVLGDAQDLAQNLSTFSGHIRQLADIAQAPLANALVLIDEIASGTDPEEGANLAAATLLTLAESGALTLVTTHLGRLKLLAATEQGQSAGFANASVLFDGETLSPTYRLAVGLPGASHALTIARRVGLPEAIVERAENNPIDSNESGSADRLLVALGEHQQQLGKTEATLSQNEQQLAERENRLAAAEAALLEKKHAFTHEVQKRLRHHVQQLETAMADTKKRLANTTNEKDLAARQRHLHRHQRHADSLIHQSLTAAQAGNHAPNIDDMTVGQKITHSTSGMTGTITAIDAKKKRLTLDCDGLTVTVPVAEVVVLAQQASQRQRKKPPKLDVLGRPVRKQANKKSETSSNYHDASKIPSNEEDPLRNVMPLAECKLLGMTVDEALQATDEFLDSSVLAGHTTVAIIHGVGTGRLKRAVRQHLKQSPLVARFVAAQAIHGGDGKTVVLLK